MQSKICLFLGIVTLVVFAAACRGGKENQPIQYTPDSRFNPEYKAVFETWTQEDRIYKGFDCKLISAATYKSIPFRRAYTREYAKHYRLSPEEKDKLLKDQLDAADTYNEFIFAAYVPDKKWDDFPEEKSTWKIVLGVDSGARAAPVEIRKLERNNVVLKHFFPYVTPWKSVYLLRFPANRRNSEEALVGDRSRTMTLSVSSVLGTAEMIWMLDNGKNEN
ncbi:MAG: hypothetical protein ABFS43_09145 [Thermodesulfobacteriota bacterium]